LPDLPRNISATVERAAFVPLDRDRDGIPDEEEPCICLGTAPGQAVTSKGCSVDQLCPCDAPLGRASWKNHAEYIWCMSDAANELVTDGALTKEQRQEIVRRAERSACGR